MPKNFKLDIYTWPAMMGTPVGMRTTEHDTVAEAKAHLDAQTEPYYCATLCRYVSTYGWMPANWHNKHGIGDDWKLMGTNGVHPFYIALRKDWDNLVDAVVLARENGDDRGTVYIAADILQERHPNTVGYAEELAGIAADRLRNRTKARDWPTGG